MRGWLSGRGDFVVRILSNADPDVGANGMAAGRGMRDPNLFLVGTVVSHLVSAGRRTRDQGPV